MTVLTLTLTLLLALSSHTVVQADQDQTDQRQPDCPSECNIDLSQIGTITSGINNKEISLSSDSCKPIDHFASSNTFKFHYKADGLRSNDDNLVHRRTQNIDEPNAGAGSVPPHPRFNQTFYGWSIEINNDSNMGSCLIAPNGIVGPFSRAEMESCIHVLDFACYNVLRRRTCPCFEADNISHFVKNLKNPNYDPDFVLDLRKSCKVPTGINSLPFGLYTKQGRYKDDDANTLQLGVDINLNKMTNRCYMGSDSSQVTAAQHSDCFSQLDSICSELKTLTVSNSCEDEENYNYKSQSWKTCHKMVNNHGPKWKVDRNCNRFDDQTGKYVFQHCRKSCQACSCRSTDNSDYRFNGQKEYSCEWIRNMSDEGRADYCQDVDVATNCQKACGKGCCKDSSNFRFRMTMPNRNGYRGLHRIERWGCQDINNAEWTDLCKQKKIAVNCPMKCRKCFMQPRNLMEKFSS